MQHAIELVARDERNRGRSTGRDSDGTTKSKQASESRNIWTFAATIIFILMMALLATMVVLYFRQHSELERALISQEQKSSKLAKNLNVIIDQFENFKSQSADRDYDSHRGKVFNAWKNVTMEVARIENIRKVLNAQAAKYSQLSDLLTEARDKIRLLETKNGYCPMKHSGRCFWIVPRYEYVDFNKSKKICEYQGGMPANIYTKNHYYMVMGHLRQFVFWRGVFVAWTGMTWRKESGTLFSDGTEARFVKWFTGSIDSEFGFNMAMVVKKTDGGSENGMWPIMKVTQGVICEK